MVTVQLICAFVLTYAKSRFSHYAAYLFLYVKATLETTIGNSNPSRSKYIQPTSILEGLRVMLANRLSTTGMDWGKNFQKFNSGT